MEQELWKEINGFNGKYEVSSFGRVRSYAQSKSGRILPGYTDAKGYITVCLYHAPQKGKFYKVHRLVATAFIDNPNGYAQVNHKDEVKANNHISNLEWCSNEYNNRYGTRIQRAGE